MSERIRCFISFDVEDQAILHKIVEVQEALNRECGGLKLVKPENIHITMRFLGEIPLSLVDSVSNVLKSVKFSPFNVKISGVGAFPNIRRPSVIWTGISDGVSELKDISEQLESGLKKLGFKPEKRAFTPHITIARVKSRRSKNCLMMKLLEFKDLEFGVIRAEFLRLKRSILTPTGPIYHTLFEFSG